MRRELTLIVISLCFACTRTNVAPPPTALPPCAPTDASWGCRGNASLPSAQANNAQPPLPTPMRPSQPSTQPSQGATPSSVPVNAAPTLPAQTPAAADEALNRGDPAFQRGRVLQLVAELISALEPALGSRVASLPITFDPDQAEVNAFATCTRSGKATIAITDGMLILTAYLAQLQSTDEALGTHHFDQYVSYVAKSQRQNSPLLAPTPEMLPGTARNLPTKLARQRQLNDEMLAFVMAHELGHHYLNHLPCTSVLPLDAAEIGMLLTDAVPALNQPNELAADVAGIRNVLAAGRRRSGGQLTEGGSLLTMRFFRALDQASPSDFFDFERTHPPPSVREPVVQTAAQAFRAAAGIQFPWQ